MNHARRAFLRGTAALSAGLIAAGKALATGEDQQTHDMPGMGHDRHKMPPVKSRQQGVPVTVCPEDRALAKPFWPSVWGSIQRRFSRLLVFLAKSSQTRAEIEKGSLDRPTSAVASVRGLAGRIGGSAVASGRFYGGIAEFAFWLLILPDAAAVA